MDKPITVEPIHERTRAIKFEGASNAQAVLDFIKEFNYNYQYISVDVDYGIRILIYPPGEIISLYPGNWLVEMQGEHPRSLRKLNAFEMERNFKLILE